MIFDQIKDIFLVSFGAVFGSNTRFIIFNKLRKLDLSKDFCILIINTFSSFLLCFLISFLPSINSHEFSNQLVLFFSIGFLGSLSTFSTFVYDLFEFSLENKFPRAFKLFFCSLILGILSLATGFILGHQ